MANETQVTIASLLMGIWLTLAVVGYFTHVNELQLPAFFLYLMAIAGVHKRWRKIIQNYTDDLSEI